MLNKIGETMSLQAPAKVNLSLYVIGKREDGYHELVTQMQKLNLYDQIDIEIVVEPGIHFFCDDPGVPCDSSNLAYRAAEVFCSKSSRIKQCGLRINLRKNIPVAAGLGGGSSDAGTVLQALNTLFEEEFSEQELVEMATPLGADVPFFAIPASAVLAKGIGEKMTPVTSFTGHTFVLVNPSFPVSTKEVFENYTVSPEKKDRAHQCFHLEKDVDLFRLHNDLEKVTMNMHSEIGEIKKTLQELGASVTLMAGSGPTVFGVFEGGRESYRFDRICKTLSGKYGNKIFVAEAI